MAIKHSTLPLLLSAALLSACGGSSGGDGSSSPTSQKPDQQQPTSPGDKPQPNPQPEPPAPSNDDDNDGVLNEQDIDDDNDGLIEISSIAMFNNIRHDLTGSSYRDGNQAITSGCPNTETIKGCNGYELTQTLNFSQSEFAKGKGDNLGWPAIGNYKTPFKAQFNGNNFTLKNFYINQNLEYSGLFGALQDASVVNLNIEGELIDGDDTKFIGILAGFIRSPDKNSPSAGIIRNVHVSGQITANSSRATGALIGEQRSGYYAVEYCSPLPCDDRIIDIPAATIIAVSSEVNIRTRGGRVGGLVGIKSGGSLVSSFAKGVIESEYATLGGLVGELKPGPKEHKNRIVSSMADNSLTTQRGAVAGGLVGIQYLDTEIIASYSANNKVVSDKTAAGFVGQWSSSSGFTTQKSRILNSYTRSQNINGGSFIHGFSAGLFNGRGLGPVVENSYWDIDKTKDGTVTSFQTKKKVIRSSHGVGYSATQLKGSEAVNNQTPGYRTDASATFDAPFHHWLPSDWTPTTNDEKLRVYCDDNGDGVIQDNENTAIWNMGNNQQYPIINCIAAEHQSRD